jgi:hypothetical protein
VRPAGSLLGHVLSFDPTGTFAPFADVSLNEALTNPIGGIDSNPFHLAYGPGGLVATDAGANTLVSISGGGAVETVAVFPDRPIGPQVPASNAVPTGVVVGPDGTTYVAELTGFPFTAGAANIYSLAPGSATPVLFAEGLTNLTDLAIAPDGTLYALSYDTDAMGPFGGPLTTGSIYRISSTGVATSIVDELDFPTGLTVGADGALYVTTFSRGLAGTGQVLRISEVPEPASWAMLLLGFGTVGLCVRRRRRAMPLPRPA